MAARAVLGERYRPQGDAPPGECVSLLVIMKPDSDYLVIIFYIKPITDIQRCSFLTRGVPSSV